MSLAFQCDGLLLPFPIMTRFLFCLLLLSPLTLPAFSDETSARYLSNGIAAVVEDQIITVDQIRYELQPLLGQIQLEARNPREVDEKIDQIGKDILSNLIDRILAVKTFEKEGMVFPESYVDNEIEDIIIRNYNDQRTELLNALRQQGKTLREFRKEVRDRLIVGFMRRRFRRSIGEVSPAKIEIFYKEHQQQFLEKEAVLLRQIMLSPKKGQEVITLQATVEAIMRQLDNDVAFASLAKIYSQDEKAQEGGEWGWINRSDIRPDLAQVAFNLSKGAYSKPIMIEGHVFILFIEDRREKHIRPLREVRDVIEEIIKDELTRQTQKRWLEQLRKDAYVRVYLQ